MTRGLALALLASGCVLDRTGESATREYQEQLSLQGSRVRDLESLSEDVGRRVAQLEEVTRARGQEEILKMETVDQLRDEVARMRGEAETLAHDYRTFETAALGTQGDVDGRLLYLEARVAALESTLGLKPPPRPGAGLLVGSPTGSDPVVAPPVVDGGGTGAPEPAAELSAEEYFGLIQGHLESGSNEAARAVAARFIAANPKSDRVGEAYYRIAESYQNANEFKAAAAAFQEVLDKAPTSTWASWALLRQGECFEGLGRAADAKLFYCDVVVKYPKSKAAKDAKVRCGK